MLYFNLVEEECRRLNPALEQNFVNVELYFISASLTEISYGLGEHRLLFRYDPERYEYGKTMILKGALIRLFHDPLREYSVDQIVSFLENNSTFFEGNSDILPLENVINKIQRMLELMEQEKNTNWENKFMEYQKSISNNWI